MDRLPRDCMINYQRGKYVSKVMHLQWLSINTCLESDREQIKWVSIGENAEPWRKFIFGTRI